MLTDTVEKQTVFKRVEKLMGNRFELTIVTSEQDTATEKLDKAVAEIRRIEKLLTTFKEESQTVAINAAAG